MFKMIPAYHYSQISLTIPNSNLATYGRSEINLTKEKGDMGNSSVIQW